MRLAIVQSNYVPWKGYFDLIQSVDEFVLFDDVQYTRRDWRNRNIIKTVRGPAWLTIPVKTTGEYLTAIKDIVVTDQGWPRHHWKTIAATYGRAPFFRQFADQFEPLYASMAEPHLSRINRVLLEAVCGVLGICTTLSWSMDYKLEAGRTERLVGICRQAGASTYVSGPSARDYIDAECFHAAGIGLEFFDYDGYPEYPQLYGPFEHRVSIIDLLCQTGPEAPRFLRRHTRSHR